MVKAWTVVGYVFKAAVFCPTCIIKVLPTGHGDPYDGWATNLPMSTEDNLNEIAIAFGIDRQNEYSFDTDDFPKVIFSSDNEGETCDKCGRELE